MSSDFSTVLVRDSVLGGITDKLTYAVKSGAASKTYQPFPFVSSSSSSLTFNVTVPSENVVVDREVFIRTKLLFTVTETGLASGFAGGYGSDYALQAFPLNHLFTTASATINNSNVSSNIQDILPQLLQMMSQEELARYDGMTPNLVDFNTALNTANIATSNANNVIATANQTGYNKYYQPRGAFSIKLVSYSKAVGTTYTTSLTATATTQIFKLGYEVEICEPIIGLSPFIYGQPAYNNQGLVGINAMNFVFNIDSSAKRLLSAGQASTIISKVELGLAVDGSPTRANTTIPFLGAELLVCFNSSQSTDLISAKNVCSYTDIPRFITAGSAVASGGATVDLNSNNIQLNQLPDLFIVCVRKPMGDLTIRDAEFNCVINSVSINLNNSSGLLSSASQFSLYQLSVKNGSKQTWSQFCGQINQAVTRTDSNGGLSTQATTGSIFVVSPTDLSLPSYLAPGCIGSFNFQIRVSVSQFTGASVTPEIVVLAVNSGIFSTVAGSSQIFTGILTKSMVEDAKSLQMVNPVLSAEYNRVLGGGIHGDLQNSGNEQMPSVKEAMKAKMKMAHSMGSGVYSGGAMSGGKFSGLVR